MTQKVDLTHKKGEGFLIFVVKEFLIWNQEQTMKEGVYP